MVCQFLFKHCAPIILATAISLYNLIPSISAVLRLGEHNEEYHFAFPTAYARSILTVPWVELADKVAITCPQTGYSASVTFHTKVRVFFRQVLHGFCFLNVHVISMWHASIFLLSFSRIICKGTFVFLCCSFPGEPSRFINCVYA